MSSVEVLPLHSDDHDASAASSILTLVGPETATTGHEYGNLRTPRPARSRTYERALVTILSRLLQPADFGAGATDRSDLLVETQSLETEEEDYESLFLVAAALLGARRMTQAADLLQRLDTIAAPRGNRQRWRARTEFLWAVYAEQSADIPTVLEHATAAGRLIEATAERPSDVHESRECHLLQTVDAVVREQLPLLAARAQGGLGEPHRAQSILEDRYGSAEAAELRQPATMAILAGAQGRLSDALRLGHAALRAVEGNDAGTEFVSLEARLALAEVFFERNALDAAQEQLEAALRWCYLAEAAPWMWTVQTYLARLSVAQLRAIDAVPRLQHLRQVSESGFLPQHLTRDLNKVEVEYRLQLGDLEGAVLIVRNSLPQDLDCETLARVELCSGRPDRVIALLGTGRAPSLAAHIRRLILLASAEKQQGRMEKATDSLRRAVEAAQPEQYTRPFLELAAQILPLLGSMAPSSPNHYLSQLISQAEQTASKPTTCHGATVLEPLSHREWQVLQELASHRTLRQIAGLMYVSVNTVKTHVKGIYRKTGATTRDEAVGIARSHGLIQGAS